MPNGFERARVLFDCYIEGTLKAKTKAKRANSATNFEIHDEMSISTIPLNDILSSSKIKKGLCELLN